jgi:beta-galactosidase
MSQPEIFINGRLAGKWDYGYNSFYLDITDYVKFDAKNAIAIHVDNRSHDSRWYPGAGIFRKIQMITVDPVHVDVWGSQVTTPIIKPTYTDVRIAHTLVNKSGVTVDSVLVENIIVSPKEVIVGKATSKINISQGKSVLTENTITLNKPERWDIDNPVLYKVKTRISKNGKILDEYCTPFGVRTMKFTADDGFWLNERRVQLKGVNLHSDHGMLGVAFNRRAMERQLEIMKSMGCNAIRNSHNVAAPEVLELCDSMGILMLNEVFDKYDKKADLDDNADFEEFAARNIKNFVLRDRKHPCVFLWSVGNEIMDVMRNENNGFYRLHTMVNYVKKWDFTRPVTLVSSAQETAALRHFDYYDVNCWNYGRRYSLARQLEPNKSVIISESASTLSTRGFYELPLPVKKTDFTKSLQVSSYDLNAPLWAEISDDDFMWQEEEPYVAGEFVWTGFDYLGEPTPYDNKEVKRMGFADKDASNSSYFGIVDMCGIPKDRYYLYKSHWKPEETTVHILPHWNWKGHEGKEIPVFVYTNGDSAELYLNGRSLGFKSKKLNSSVSTERYRLMWKNVKYESGQLKAIAYKNGKVIGQSIVKTAGNPYKIVLKPDRKTIKADGADLSYVLVEVYDNDGNICPLADNMIKFKVSDNGKIAGVGNGNPQSMEPFKADFRKLFFGKAMLVVQSSSHSGEIKITAESDGLVSNEISVFSR